MQGFETNRLLNPTEPFLKLHIAVEFEYACDTPLLAACRAPRAVLMVQGCFTFPFPYYPRDAVVTILPVTTLGYHGETEGRYMYHCEQRCYSPVRLPHLIATIDNLSTVTVQRTRTNRIRQKHCMIHSFSEIHSEQFLNIVY